MPSTDTPLRYQAGKLNFAQSSLTFSKRTIGDGTNSAPFKREAGWVCLIADFPRFFNRTNRSGIISGGVIGGLEQNRNYKVGCRFNKVELIKKIRKNLDPPYYVRGPELYRNHFTHSDHAKLAEAVANIDQSWMVTYDDTPEIRALYSDFTTYKHALNYSAWVKRVGGEIWFWTRD